MYRTNERTIFEKDFYYPKRKYPYPTTTIREYEYYYFLLPKNGTRIYGKSIDELYEKLIDENMVFRSYFSDKLSLKEAIHVWNVYGHYQSTSKKDRLYRAIETISQSFENSEGENPLTKPYESVKTDDLQLLIDEFSKNFDEKIARGFYEEILVFVECLNFLDVKVSSKKLEFRVIEKAPKQNNIVYITQKELKLFDNEVVSNGTRYKYQDESYIVIMVLHTGISSKQAFYLKWGQIDFTNRQINSDGKVYPMDDFIFNALYQLKERKTEEETAPDMPMFPVSLKDGYTYAYALNTYQVILRNCLITQKLSLRDLQLIKGKQLLDAGMPDEDVCKLLGITKKRQMWQRMHHFQIIDDTPKVDYAANVNGINALIKVAEGLNEKQIDKLIKYIDLIKQTD